MCKLSIIVPIYNTDRSLGRCIDSILSQSTKEIELILIDDGSVDNSGVICDSYAKKDNRVKVIHKKNEGVSIARNTGINVAIGEYIGFVDADDYLDKDMCSEAYRAAIAGNYDMVMFDTYIVKDINSENKLSVDTITQLERSCELKKNDIYPILLRYMAGTVWRCLYKREFINRHKISFPASLPLSEDRIFNIMAMGCCRKMYYLKSPLYYYCDYSIGAVRQYRADYFDIALKTNKLMSEVLKIYWNDECIKIYDKVNIVDGAFRHIGDLSNTKKTMKFNERIGIIKGIINNDELQRILNKKDKLRFRERIMLNKHSLLVYIVEVDIINKLRKIKNGLKKFISR